MVSYGTRALRLPLPFGFAVALLVAALLVRLSGLFRACAMVLGGK